MDYRIITGTDSLKFGWSSRYSILEYSSVVWSPHSVGMINSICSAAFYQETTWHVITDILMNVDVLA